MDYVIQNMLKRLRVELPLTCVRVSEPARPSEPTWLTISSPVSTSLIVSVEIKPWIPTFSYYTGPPGSDPQHVFMKFEQVMTRLRSDFTAHAGSYRDSH